MERKLIAVLVANLFIATPAFAFEAFNGSVSLGGLYVDKDTKDAAKLNEYRDMSDGVLSAIELQGKSEKYYLNFFGENLARDDQFLNLTGGMKGNFKYNLFSDRLKHNFTFDARSPYSGIGTALQTIPLPVTTGSATLNPATWNTYDLGYKRRNDGGGIELSFGTPFFARFDVSQVKFEGNKLQAYAQGTSPGNGFVDFAIPVDSTTKNFQTEVGYATRTITASLSYLQSKYQNNNDVLQWSNGFFNGLDASPLAPDNEYKRLALNAAFRKLPVGDSTLALRYTTSKSENNVSILQTQLNTGVGTGPGTTPATNPTSPVFNGNVEYDTYSAVLNSYWGKLVDTKFYLNSFKKENKSSRIDFVNLPAGLSCGDAPVVVGPPALSACDTELFSYEKRNYGAEAGVKFMPGNKLLFTYDYSKIDRERPDSTETKDTRYGVEYRNTMLDMVTARLKYSNLSRKSNFLEADAGANAQDPLYLTRFVAKFDVSNLDQNVIKLSVDLTPSEFFDIGAEYAIKSNKYKDTVLGRTKDSRDEIYLQASFGDRDVFRITGFVNWENVKYDSYHRNISNLTAAGAYDPFAAATAQNYNWSATNKDQNSAFGLGFEWPVLERLMIKGSTVWARSEGSVDVTAQRLASGAPAAALANINNYGNNEKLMFNLKGIYTINRNWEVTGGLAYEDVKFNDVQFNGYTYVVPVATSGTSTSYLSGWYASPDYRATVVYVMGKYRF